MVSPPLESNDLSNQEALKLLHAIRIGTFKMSKQQFRNVLKRSIGADKEYADGCWKAFKDAPMHYICSRSDAAQSLELIRMCRELGETE